MNSQKLRAKILKDIKDGYKTGAICEKYGVNRHVVHRLRVKSKTPVKVPEFRCPLCRTKNYLKAQFDDNICFACSLRMFPPHARK